MTNDLHISIALSLHQSFPWLRFTIFRVHLTEMLLFKPLSIDQSVAGANIPAVIFIVLASLTTRTYVGLLALCPDRSNDTMFATILHWLP